MATGDWCSPSQTDFQGLGIPANTGKKKRAVVVGSKGIRSRLLAKYSEITGDRRVLAINPAPY